MRWRPLIPSLLLALLATATSSSASEFLSPRFGAQVGLNMAHFAFPNPEHLPLPLNYYKSRFAYQLGVAAQVPVRGPLYLQSGLIFNLKGEKVEYQTTFSTIEDPWTPISGRLKLLSNLYYLSLPILIGVRLGSGPVRPTLSAGPEFSYLVLNRQSSVLKGGGHEISDSETVHGLYPSTDFGLTFAAGLDFPAVSQQLSVQCGYTLGLRNLNASSNGNVHHIYNRTLFLFVQTWLLR